METIVKNMQKVQFRTLPVKEATRFPVQRPLTPHLNGLKDDIMNSIKVKFFTDYKEREIKAGEVFNLKIKMRIIHPLVALKDVHVWIRPNIEYVTMDENIGYAHFEKFSFRDGWIFTDLKLKVLNRDILLDHLYDIADITFEADVDYKSLFHLKKRVKDVEVYFGA